MKDELSLYDECVLAKDSLNLTVEILKKLSEGATPQKSLAIASTLRDAVLEVSRVTKCAAEVESLKVNKAEQLRMAKLVRRLPDLIRNSITTLATRVKDDLISIYGGLPASFEYLNNIEPYVVKVTSQFKIEESAVKPVTEQQIREMLTSVPQK